MPFPDWLVPMAATLTAERFKEPGWIFERKLDGIRLLAFADLPVRDVILDGEAAWDPDSLTAYHVFDILRLDGRDLTRLPLRERLAILKELPLHAPLGTVPEVHGETPWETACEHGWEGVIAKRLDSIHEHKRSKHWLKMKCDATQELVVGGFTDPQGAPGAWRAARRVLRRGRPRLRRQGRHRLQHRAAARPARATRSPGDSGGSLHAREGLTPVARPLVAPQLVVQVAFMEWTGHDTLRHPRLVGIRADKNARDVVREKA